MKNTPLMLLLLVAFFQATAMAEYPTHWWSPVNEKTPSWEITPDKAIPGEQLILSKRNELGVFSNLGAAQFIFENVSYGSVEGLWQMMKYPDASDSTDPRNNYESYPYTRHQVKLLSGFKSKKAGDAANAINREQGITWVSYKGSRFNYKDMADGSRQHYRIIRGAIRAKVLQNPKIKDLLISTGNLELLPDHTIKSSKPRSYFYNIILMELRAELKAHRIQ